MRVLEGASLLWLACVGVLYVLGQAGVPIPLGSSGALTTSGESSGGNYTWIFVFVGLIVITLLARGILELGRWRNSEEGKAYHFRCKTCNRDWPVE